MARVSGIGGIFFRSRDPAALQAWYREHLDVPLIGETVVFRWREAERDREGSTVWAPFAHDTDYFEPGQATMTNFRVDDLDEALADLRAHGVTVLERIEESELGRFGWCLDPEGNRIELWQPPPGY